MIRAILAGVADGASVLFLAARARWHAVEELREMQRRCVILAHRVEEAESDVRRLAQQLALAVEERRKAEVQVDLLSTVYEAARAPGVQA